MKRYLILLSSLCVFGGAAAQPKLNWGLTHPQDKAGLPVSLAPFGKPNADTELPSGEKLRKTGNCEYILEGGWKLAPAAVVTAKGPFDSSDDGWYDAVVPGTVLTTLVRRGVFPDPYYGLNNLAIPDTLCRTDWWYRTSFHIPKEKRGKQAQLLFNGINYRAEVWLNNSRLGRIDGAFRRGTFDVTRQIDTAGENILAVRIFPPANPGIPHEQTLAAGAGANGGIMCLDGPTFICSEGWDWMPGIRDRNIGIWQDVNLIFSDGVRIVDPQVITDLPLPDTTSVRITVAAGIENTTEKKQRVLVRGRIEETHFEQSAEIAPHSRTTVCFSPDRYEQLKLRDPRLWWPNDLGRQELYDLTLEVFIDEKLSHAQTTRFGVREYSYELTADAGGRQDIRLEYSPTDLGKCDPIFDNTARRQRSDKIFVPRVRDNVPENAYRESDDNALAPYLVLKVNGVKVFCRGGNWGMDDAMKNISRERLEPYFRLHKDAHVNMVRNWTGESTEEIFYSLCDEYGMIVFNDFWISTEGFNLNVADDELLLANATDVVRRFRNHPSIAFWNPRNEGFAPDRLEERLNAMIAAEDGTRHYQPNSRSLNLRPSGPWNYMKDPKAYFTRNANGFTTEIGTPSVPTSESMQSMMAPEDLWPIGDVWAYHDLHNGQKEYCKAIAEKYGEPSGLDDFCKKAQLVNYDSHRAIFEAWNSRMWTGTSGVLLWMTHPAWPSTVWQIYSWDYETHGAYFGVRKACEPIHIQVNPHDAKVIAVNSGRQAIPDARITHRLYTIDGKLLAERKNRMMLSANAVTECFTAEYPAELPDVYLERVCIYDGKGRILSLNEYWKSNRLKDSFRPFNLLPEAVVTGRIVKSGSEHSAAIELQNRSDFPAIALKLNLRNPKNGKRILPAFFSDGYFTLLPGEKRTVTLDANESGAVTVEGYNIPRKTIIDTIRR